MSMGLASVFYVELVCDVCVRSAEVFKWKCDA